jgi:hypothetical protein
MPTLSDAWAVKGLKGVADHQRQRRQQKMTMPTSRTPAILRVDERPASQVLNDVHVYSRDPTYIVARTGPSPG